MQELICGEPPDFQRLLEFLREIEREINGLVGGWVKPASPIQAGCPTIH